MLPLLHGVLVPVLNKPLYVCVCVSKAQRFAKLKCFILTCIICIRLLVFGTQCAVVLFCPDSLMDSLCRVVPGLDCLNQNQQVSVYQD